METGSKAGTGRTRAGGGGVFGLVDRRIGWVLGIVLAVAMASPAVRAQKPSRDDVLAAYLYNFGKFVRWPESRGLGSPGSMVVCVAGEAPLGPTMAKLVEGEQIGGRPVEERDVAGPEGVGACSILFVGAGEQEREQKFLAAAEGKPILTVGDAPDFLERGGMIQFVLVGDHVRFSVNLEAVNRHRMVVSSELLKVAVTVTGAGEPGTGGAK
jgi:YfiR/HmsC-like